MYRSNFYAVTLLALGMPMPVMAQEFYTIDEIVGYVNLEQTNIFQQGDTLTGTSRVTVFPPETIGATYFWYVRARMLAFGNWPVTEWVEDGEWIAGEEVQQLAPVASQYTVPIPNLSSSYTYEVQFRYIETVQGGPPGDHYTIATDAFFFTY